MRETTTVTVRGLHKITAQMNGEIHITSNGRDYDIEVTAPPRMVWKARGVHRMVENVPNATPRSRAIVRTEIASSMLMGTEPCTDTNCDVCMERDATVLVENRSLSDPRD
jgi:hypothetical protein